MYLGWLRGFQARTGGCPEHCAAWLSGDSDEPPGHLCLVAAGCSTNDFAHAFEVFTSVIPPTPHTPAPGTAEAEIVREWRRAEEAGLGVVTTWSGPPLLVAARSAFEHYAGAWPLPVSRASFARWYSTWAAHVYGPDMAAWPIPQLTAAPLVTDAEAWAGMAARRDTEAGSAWLLGLVEQNYGYTASAPRGGFVIMSETAEPTDAARQMAVNEGGIWGNRQYVRNELWRWADPVVLLEANARTAADLDALTAAVRPLLEWYNRTLLGKTFRTGGPVPLFTTQAQCRTAVVNAYRAALRRSQRPTRALVASRLGYTESGLRDALTRWGLKWKDLVAEARAGK